MRGHTGFHSKRGIRVAISCCNGTRRDLGDGWVALSDVSATDNCDRHAISLIQTPAFGGSDNAYAMTSADLASSASRAGRGHSAEPPNAHITANTRFLVMKCE